MIDLVKIDEDAVWCSIETGQHEKGLRAPLSHSKLCLGETRVLDPKTRTIRYVLDPTLSHARPHPRLPLFWTNLNQEGKVDAVKVEGGVNRAEHIHKIVDGGIAVVGHVGLTPQAIR